MNRPMQSIEALTVEFAAWCKKEGVEPASADELMASGAMSLNQTLWLMDFTARWDAAQDAGERYSVYVFFHEGGHEKVRHRVDAKEAVDAFTHYRTSVAAKHGLTTRVIITDGGDFTNAEWVYGKGVVYPITEPQEANHG